jgi:hypothetical protein
MESYTNSTIDYTNPIISLWFGNYTTNVTNYNKNSNTILNPLIIAPINDPNTNAITNVQGTYNGQTYDMLTFTTDILILKNSGNLQQEIILKQIDPSTFTNSNIFQNQGSQLKQSLQNLQFYNLYMKNGSNGKLQNIAGSDKTNLFDYSLKLFSPLTSPSKFEISFVQDMKPILSNSNVGIQDYSAEQLTETFCLNPTVTSNLFSLADLSTPALKSFLQQNNLQLASIDQLQKILEKGAEWVIPGWVSDSTNANGYTLAYPLQIPKTSNQTFGINKMDPPNNTLKFPLVVYGIKPNQTNSNLSAIGFRDGFFGLIQTPGANTSWLTLSSNNSTVNLSQSNHSLFALIPYIPSGQTAIVGYIVEAVNSSGNFVLTQNADNIILPVSLPQTITSEMIFTYDFNNTSGAPIISQSNPNNVLQSKTTTTTSETVDIFLEVTNTTSVTNIIMAPCPSGSNCNFQYIINNINTMGGRFAWSVSDGQVGSANIVPINVTLNTGYNTANLMDCVGICEKTYLCETASWNDSTNNCSLFGSTLQAGNIKSSPNYTSVNIQKPMPSMMFGIGRTDGLLYVRENAPLNSPWQSVKQTALTNGNQWKDIVATADPNTPGLYNLVLLDNTFGTRKVYAGTYTKGSFQLSYALAPQLNKFGKLSTGTLTRICNNPGNNQGYSMLGLYHDSINYYLVGYSTSTSQWINISTITSVATDLAVDQSGNLYVATTVNSIWRNTLNANALSNNQGWVHMNNDCCVSTIEFAPDNRLFCNGTDFNIYYKPTNDINAVMQGTNPGWIGPIISNPNIQVSTFVLL